jgi:deoxyribodipyrimidine photo-lyase
LPTSTPSSEASSPVILWFRRDLRLADNPALTAAVETGRPVLPLFILDEESDGIRPLGGASKWWLHQSLASLGQSLKARGSSLILRRGPAAEVIDALLEETGSSAVYWNRLYDKGSIDRDTAIKKALTDRDIDAQSFNAALLIEPWKIANKSGKPFRVFTPFWKALAPMVESARPEPAPDEIPDPTKKIASDGLDDWELEPRKPDWAAGFRDFWTPGEDGALEAAAHFRDTSLADYKRLRDAPGEDRTSRLSPHLHFGEIGPRQLWYAVTFWNDRRESGKGDDGGMSFLRELGWREFNQHLLFHFPKLPIENVDDAFDAFEWRRDKKGLTAWQRGRTGYPIVDAGMREIWQTGWMHNRVRMAAASFLIKHLLIDWRRGEEWFWDTLLDADPANNAGNWQWVAGCGFDAAPYFRIFNPILQGERFDKDGAYVRRWVPEIADLPDKYLHKPWEAPADILEDAGIVLGDTYPEPIVDHKAARQRALDAYAAIKKSRG